MTDEGNSLKAPKPTWCIVENRTVNHARFPLTGYRSFISKHKHRQSLHKDDEPESRIIAAIYDVEATIAVFWTIHTGIASLLPASLDRSASLASSLLVAFTLAEIQTRDEEKTVLTRWLWSKRNDGFLLGSPICGLYNDPESIDGPSTRRSQTQPRLGFNDGFLRASFHPDLICARTLCNVLDPKDRPNSGEDPVAVVTRSHDTVVGKHMCPHEQFLKSSDFEKEVTTPRCFHSRNRLGVYDLLQHDQLELVHFPHINTPKVLAKYVLLAGRRYLRGWMGFCSSVGENQTGNVAFRKLGQSTIN
ncbi:hypothetical protein EDD18DRAFT_1108423 [Armillaria luteobubalina]|uniref:Uncharacterized protein n=1 Tax=Armillaria luteobubalina TaxID=153913 RepID=A0AA39PZ29_9AGAR|nr:hypothetical protein EDD18DRAFT_1108423 [Armillaria luteobubalina]